MGLRELEAALELVAKYPDLADFEGPKPPELIASAESALGLAFPPSYRKFLERLGAGNFGSFEVFGVIGDEFMKSGIPDAVWLTLRARREWTLPRALVVVHFGGATDYFALDTSRAGAEAENPLVLWHPGRIGRPDAAEIMAPDFGSFLLVNLRAELERSRGATGPH